MHRDDDQVPIPAKSVFTVEEDLIELLACDNRHNRHNRHKGNTALATVVTTCRLIYTDNKKIVITLMITSDFKSRNC